MKDYGYAAWTLISTSILAGGMFWFGIELQTRNTCYSIPNNEYYYTQIEETWKGTYCVLVPRK